MLCCILYVQPDFWFESMGEEEMAGGGGNFLKYVYLGYPVVKYQVSPMPF